MSAVDKVGGMPLASEAVRAKAHQRARMLARPGDWLWLILDHHERILDGFAAVRRAPDAGARRAAQKNLVALVTGHSIAEEGVIYPALAASDEVSQSDMAYAQQVAAKIGMAALEKLDPMSGDFGDLLDHLEQAIAHHAYQEESEWLLDLKGKASAADEVTLTRRFKEEFARYMNGPPVERADVRSFG